MFDRLGMVPFLYVGEHGMSVILPEPLRGNSKYKNQEMFGRADIRMEEFISEKEEEEEGDGPGPF